MIAPCLHSICTYSTLLLSQCTPSVVCGVGSTRRNRFGITTEGGCISLVTVLGVRDGVRGGLLSASKVVGRPPPALPNYWEGSWLWGETEPPTNRKYAGGAHGWVARNRCRGGVTLCGRSGDALGTHTQVNSKPKLLVDILLGANGSRV